MKTSRLLMLFTISSLLLACSCRTSEVNTNNTSIPTPTAANTSIRPTPRGRVNKNESNIDSGSIPVPPPPTPPPARQPEVEWGVLANYFTISNAQIGRQMQRDPLGRVNEVNALTFTVEAKTTMTVAIFFAHYYDADDIEVAPLSPVQFSPDYSTYQWQPGNRSRATVLLPNDMSKLRTIRFQQL